MEIYFNGAVMQESEFRAYQQSNGGPTWEITTPEVLASLGASVVLEGPQATGGDHYQYSQRDGVEQINGQWFTKYILGPVFQNYFDENNILHTAEEQETAYKAQKDAEQAKSVRDQRGIKLAECDWVVIKALEASQPLEFNWAVYRQALRDITKQAGFPWTIDWPVAP
jgi:hypothetical protein